MSEHRNPRQSAVAMLVAASIPASEEFYGFSVSHPELADTDHRFAISGDEHDWSTSIAMYTAENPPVVCFFRFDFIEAAQFLIDAYALCSSTPSRTEIIAAMRQLDCAYDHNELDRRIERWCEEMSAKTGRNYIPRT
ncbi:MAG: hypothetical protein AAGE59_26000 [Cyanobacteria bacterium P01_F01_bin.86]